MAIQRILNNINIQWDNGDPVVTLVARFLDDVELTDATLHYSIKRAALGTGQQTRLDSFLSDVLIFADNRTGGRGIAYPPVIPITVITTGDAILERGISTTTTVDAVLI